MWRLLLLAGLALMGQDSTVVLLRHAEKGISVPGAPLTASGRLRAEALVLDLAPFKPDALFASDHLRTQLTLAPLAQRLGLEVQIRARGGEAEAAREILARYRGRTVIVCAHSDTLGDWVEALGIKTPFPAIRSYDGLWILTLPQGQGEPTLIRRAQHPRS